MGGGDNVGGVLGDGVLGDCDRGGGDTGVDEDSSRGEPTEAQKHVIW